MIGHRLSLRELPPKPPLEAAQIIVLRTRALAFQQDLGALQITNVLPYTVSGTT